MVPTVHAIRYVLPLKEGGSVPALVEADDLGMYVVKLKGAAQGPKALIAELVAGELGRAAGLPVPALAIVELDARMAESEPDPEICLPLEKSVGDNLGLDYLPGSVMFDPVASRAPDARLASRITLFDAFVANVDRTARNTNLLYWHRQIWLIDHGAALWFHHGWSELDPLEGVYDPFAEVKDHVLLRWATELEEASTHLDAVITPDLVRRVVDAVPSSWLDAHAFSDETAHRAAYVGWLTERTKTIPRLVEEAERARSRRV